ncbi:MAG: thiazole biosynthesis protein [Elusimicrobia bacterium]|nr:thiazole biosynthesis protein [Elusimicrobiota bacterium]
MIEEIEITKAIIKTSVDELMDSLQADVVIGGGGPSGLVAGKYLAQAGKKVVLFERKLSVGGGMWGGGMMFPKIVVQKEALGIMDEFSIKYEKKGSSYVSSSIEAVSKLISGCCDAGCRIFNCISIEDVMIRENCVCGVVINWSTVEISGLHVDPVTVSAKAVIDATGHPLEICKIVERKAGKLDTSTGKILGERSMWAEKAESMVVGNTRQIFPGLYVSGMAANAAFGAPRMGPIFGGMLLSGKEVSKKVLEAID